MSNERRYSLLENVLFPPCRVAAAAMQASLGTKTILITGASYGIGEQLALQLAPSGAHLLLVARTADKLSDVMARVEQCGAKATIYPCDLTDGAQLDELISILLARPGGIDIVVSNAGKSIRRSINHSLERHHDFTRTMSLNYLAPVKLLLALITGLEARGGHIVNVSAINVLLPPAPGWAAYQASKTAMDQWVRSVGPELAPKGVAVTSVYLPLVRTRMISPTKSYDRMPAMHPAHAARILCKALLSRRRKFVPWWCRPTVVAATLLSPLVPYFMKQPIKNPN